MKDMFDKNAMDPETKVLVLTGADPYYCAGVNLSSTIRPMHPKYETNITFLIFIFKNLPNIQYIKTMDL